MLASCGVIIDRGTLGAWVTRVAWWLQLLYDALLVFIRSQPRVFCDEAPLPRLDPGRKRTKLCQLWAQAVNDLPWNGPALKAQLTELSEDVSSKSALGKAVAYTLNHWSGLTAFLDDGRIEVDPSLVERSMKSVALTRKNPLFAGRARSGETFAILASLVNTCKPNGVDPEVWLADALERIIKGAVTANRTDTLFPWHWKAERDQQPSRAACGMTDRKRHAPPLRLDDETFEAFMRGRRPLPAVRTMPSLDGYLTALIIGPKFDPRQWIPLLTGAEALNAPMETTKHQAVETIVAKYNRISASLAETTGTHRPRFSRVDDRTYDSMDWRINFLIGTDFAEKQWQPVIRAHAVTGDIIAPIRALSHATEQATPSEVTAVPEAIVRIRSYFMPRRAKQKFKSAALPKPDRQHLKPWTSRRAHD